MMALGIVITPLQLPTGSLAKGRKLRFVQFSGDTDKPGAGYVVTAANLNLRLIHGVVMGQQNDGNYIWAASVDTTKSSTASTNQMTLQVYGTLGSGGSVAASADPISTAVVSAFVYGV